MISAHSEATLNAESSVNTAVLGGKCSGGETQSCEPVGFVFTEGGAAPLADSRGGWLAFYYEFH